MVDSASSSALRQRRRATPENGSPAEVADAASPESASYQQVRIDTRQGHVGITCSNASFPGVLVDATDPKDLAAAAGLKAGDVIVRCDGVPVAEHQALVNAIDTATKSKKSVMFEYLPACGVMPQKSIEVAYLCFLVYPLGLHHFYLGRDIHAFLHLVTFGFFGVGFLPDLFLMSRYTSMANCDPWHVATLRKLQDEQPKPKSRGWRRYIGMLVLGSVFGFFASCFVPAQIDLPWHPLATVLIEAAMRALGASLAVYLIGSVPPQAGSPTRTLRTAALFSVGAQLLFGGRSAVWAALGAIRGFGFSAAWASPTAPPRRVRVSTARRALVVACAASACWGGVAFGAYQHAAFVTRKADGTPHVVRFKDLVHNVVRSPFFRAMPSILYTVFTEGPARGFQWSWQHVASELDLSGEDHACEVLGLAKQCVRDWRSVKKAYRTLALETHPDKQAQAGGSEEERKAAEARFRDVQEAYEKLQELRGKLKDESDEQGSGAAGADA